MHIYFWKEMMSMKRLIMAIPRATWPWCDPLPGARPMQSRPLTVPLQRVDLGCLTTLQVFKVWFEERFHGAGVNRAYSVCQHVALLTSTFPDFICQMLTTVKGVWSDALMWQTDAATCLVEAKKGTLKLYKINKSLKKHTYAHTHTHTHRSQLK